MKFGQKLDFLTDMRDYFRAERQEKSILVGDLNIAPREDDVWDHKKLLKIVSHTPIEVDHLAQVMEAGGWSDATRRDIPEGKLYSWWSYRAPDWDMADRGRRLDHLDHARYRQCQPFEPDSARYPWLGTAQRPCAGVCDL